MYAFLSDNSMYGVKAEAEMEQTGFEFKIFLSPDGLKEAVDDSYAAVIIVNPGARTIKSVRENLGKLGGRVSRIPVIGVFEDLDLLPDTGTLKELDDFTVGENAVSEVDVRTKALMARREVNGNVIRCGELLIYLDSHKVLLNNRPVDLTYKEFKLLCLLAAKPGRVYSRDELLRNLWGYDYFGGTRTVDVHIRRLRSKIQGSAEYIETVHGVGYRFISAD